MQYRDLFGDGREFEPFTLRQVGLLAETKRKALPRIAKTVLAERLYGESGEFTSALSRVGVPLWSPSAPVWTATGERQRQTRWRAFDRTRTDGPSERRSLQELLFGRRRRVRFCCITTDPVQVPPETTWLRMTTLPDHAEQTVGDLFGVRTGIEDGVKQVKDELGWADERVTDAASMERWWELVMSAYLLVSLQSPVFAALGATQPAPPIA